MVVEGIPARPVDEVDEWVGTGLAVVGERRAGIQQHVGDA